MKEENRGEFFQRLVVSTGIVSLSCVLLFFSNHWIIQAIILLLFMLLSSLVLWECVQLAERKRISLPLPWILVVGGLLVFAFFLSSLSPTYQFLPASVFFLSLVLVFLLHLRKVEGSLIAVGLSSFILLYGALPLGMMIALLYSPKVVWGWSGKEWFIFLLVITKVTDMGAYVGGKLLGKRLLSVVSPKKTWEGFVFGSLSALIIAALFTLYNKDYWIGLMGYALVFSLMGQLGDLTESLLKRDAQVKDSNRLPGLGGVLDMVDSLLFTAPMVYFFILYWK